MCREHWRKEENRQKKNIEKWREKGEKQEESQITAIYIFGFKLYFTGKHNVWKKLFIPLHNEILFTDFCVAGYLKYSNDTPKLNIHKYTNYNIIEIYINR